MYLKMPGETLNGNYESLTDDQLKQMLDTLKKELEKRQGTENPQRSGDQTNDADLNVDNVHLYSWGGKKLEKSGVLDVIKSLKGPYKTEVNGFVKGNDILGLQRYLNAKIDSGAIDKTKLEAALSAKRIWLRGGHLLEDGMFGPQTMETIKVLAELPEGGAEEQVRQEAIAEENKDVEGLDSKEQVLRGKKRNVYKIGDVDKVPASGKWTDEKKVYRYDVKKQTGGGLIYDRYEFFNDGKCVHSEVVGGLTKKSEELDTDVVLSKLKNGGAYEGSISSMDVKRSIVDSIKSQCADALKTKNGETIGFTTYGSQVRATLSTGVYPTTVAEVVDLKDCLKADGTIDKDYTEKVVLKRAKEALVRKKKTLLGWRMVKQKYGSGGKRGLGKSTLFGERYAGNPVINGKLDKYFKLFDDNLIVLDTVDTTCDLDAGKIKFELDDDNGNEDFNKWKKNPDLIIDGPSIVKDDYTLNEYQFQKIMGDIVMKIISRPEFN